ncbi:hypothetical protein LCGC14_3046910, partial [marine sediment metagenome]
MRQVIERIMEVFLILGIIFALSGCMTDYQAVLDKCPKYAQDNVGKIHYFPISWGTLLGISGVTDKNTGEIWLTLWAD